MFKEVQVIQHGLWSERGGRSHQGCGIDPAGNGEARSVLRELSGGQGYPGELMGLEREVPGVMGGSVVCSGYLSKRC